MEFDEIIADLVHVRSFAIYCIRASYVEWARMQ
jgi:hypothetical protein